MKTWKYKGVEEESKTHCDYFRKYLGSQEKPTYHSMKHVLSLLPNEQSVSILISSVLTQTNEAVAAREGVLGTTGTWQTDKWCLPCGHAAMFQMENSLGSG